ncbi:hypothetical protein B9G69_004130 [Bdellovibrio sp. SKB1291214]|uniref:hypothetical protein n=1 Tax=Bdellovibrio sp. SKB1291214 TaxID=1732569 RepID=UPI000B5193E5|nr:hypothetical protein [Bdellovibrio sp. SKB1291214]UYL09761.1 hypothetical protein B9G69_004130 [Bdellovibrio sp. SKB1291214]
MNKIILATAALMLSQFAIAATSAAPVESKEDVIFAHKKDQKMLGFANADSFVGYFTRTAQADKNMRQAELYDLAQIQDLKMDEALCKKALAEIFGNLNEITLKAQDVKIWTSHTGKTCEASMVDPYVQAVIPERRIHVGFIKAKPYAIVFKLAKKSTAEQQENMRSFWDSLR